MKCETDNEEVTKTFNIRLITGQARSIHPFLEIFQLFFHSLEAECFINFDLI